MSSRLPHRFKNQIAFGQSLIALLLIPGVAAAQLACPAFIAGSGAVAPSTREPVAAREALIQMCTRWNGRFPQNSGMPFVSIGMASVLMRNPSAIDELMKPLSDAEADQMGAAANVYHALYGVPAHYDRLGGAVSTRGSDGINVFGPDRIRGLYAAFAVASLFRTVAFATSMTLGEAGRSSAPEALAWMEHFGRMRGQVAAYPQALFGPVDPRIRDYLRSQTNSDRRRFLRRVGGSIQDALVATARSGEGERHRVAQATRFGASRDVELTNEFGERLEERLNNEFPELSSGERTLIHRSVMLPM